MKAGLLALAMIALAAPASSADLFGGYSALRDGSSHVSGAAAGVSWRLAPDWRLVAEASGQSGLSAGENLREVALTAGPVWSLRPGGRVRPFLHVKGGVLRSRREVEVFGVSIGADGVCDGGCPSSTGVVLEGGGGLDVGLTGRLALRLPEVDYRWRRAGGVSDGGLRVAGGLVLRFGN